MSHLLSFLKWLLIAVLVQAGPSFSATMVEDRDLWFFVLVKSSNYSQDAEGELELLNYHFFSELFAKSSGLIKSATLTRMSPSEQTFDHTDRGDAFYYEGGHFKTLAGVDAAHPNGDYRFNIQFHSGAVIDTTMTLAGPGGKTDIPAAIQIYLDQGGLRVRSDRVDPDQALTVSWSPYSNGASDPKGIVDDMIFVVFQDCRGERVFHTGLPFKEKNYLTYKATEVIVPAGRFEAGHDYAMFVEFPHRVDSAVVGGTPAFTSYATATYLDVRTTGDGESECPEKAPPLDTGQTDRMDVEIN